MLLPLVQVQPFNLSLKPLKKFIFFKYWNLLYFLLDKKKLKIENKITKQYKDFVQDNCNNPKPKSYKILSNSAKNSNNLIPDYREII